MARRLSLSTSRLWSPAFTHTLQEFSVPFPATAFLIILSSFPCCSSAFLSSQNTRVESLGFFVFFFSTDTGQETLFLSPWVCFLTLVGASAQRPIRSLLASIPHHDSFSVHI